MTIFIFRLFSMTYEQSTANLRRILNHQHSATQNIQVWRWLLAIFAIFQLTACSFTSLGYNTLPSLMVWQADRYFYLTDVQKSLVNERLTAVHRWHRSNELPVYIKFLGETDDRLQTSVPDEATLAQWRKTVLQRWPIMAEQLAPGVAELMLTLSPEQARRAKKKLTEDNEKYKKEYLLEGSSRQKARLERYTKRAEFFVGDLDEKQMTYLREVSQKLPNAESAWFTERQARQDAFFTLLERLQQEKASQAQATEAVSKYLLGLWTSKDPQRAQIMERSAQASDQISTEILRMASAEQKALMRKKLRTYAQDFEKLYAQN
jgi:Family of unknown function (DUF6279)